MKRTAYIDNIKGYLVLLVVVGHVVATMKNHFYIGRPMFMFIYIFHMPTFTFISGFLSNEQKGWPALKKHFQKIMVPYIIFQAIMTAIRLAYYPFNATELHYLKYMPQFGLWYIFCLFFWRALLPYYLKIPLSLPLSFLLGLLWGFCFPDNPYFLSASRFLAFFPFFVLGYHAKKNDWRFMKSGTGKRRACKAAAVGILARNDNPKLTPCDNPILTPYR